MVIMMSIPGGAAPRPLDGTDGMLLRVIGRFEAPDTSAAAHDRLMTVVAIVTSSSRRHLGPGEAARQHRPLRRPAGLHARPPARIRLRRPSRTSCVVFRRPAGDVRNGGVDVLAAAAPTGALATGVIFCWRWWVTRGPAPRWPGLGLANGLVVDAGTCGATQGDAEGRRPACWCCRSTRPPAGSARR